MNLKGFRTKISAAFAGAPMLAQTISAGLESSIVSDAVSSHPVLFGCYQCLSILAAWYYKDNASENPEATAVSEPSKPEFLPDLDDFELELKGEIDHA